MVISKGPRPTTPPPESETEETQPSEEPGTEDSEAEGPGLEDSGQGQL